jgi:hypothetical protein
MSKALARLRCGRARHPAAEAAARRGPALHQPGDDRFLTPMSVHRTTTTLFRQFRLRRASEAYGVLGGTIPAARAILWVEANRRQDNGTGKSLGSNPWARRSTRTGGRLAARQTIRG